METFLMIALGISFFWIMVQGVMLYKMSQWLKDDQPPF
jgi:hypothetical protein